MSKRQNARRAPRIKGVLLHHLQALALELKRTPTAQDVTAAARRGKCPSVGIYQEEFQSLQNALSQAGLPLNFNQQFTRPQLIAQLIDLAQSLGRGITDEDVSRAARAGACARPSTFKRVCGSLRSALREAGVSAYKRAPYNREELIKQLVRLSKELGRAPSARDIDRAAKARKCANADVFKRNFGGIRRARAVAGLHSGKLHLKRHTREELIEELQNLAARLGRIPRSSDIRFASVRNECASVKTFRNFFGGHNQALAAAGFSLNKAGSYSDAQLIVMLQTLAKKLGRTPSVSDIDKAHKKGECPSSITYKLRFGSLGSAAKAARLALKRAYAKPIQYNDAELIEQLRRLTEKLGRQPTEADTRLAGFRGECAGTNTFRRRFGTFTKALRAAGYEPQRHRIYTREAMIRSLQEMTVELKRLPICSDLVEWRKLGRCATPGTYARVFGSVPAAREEAGLDRILEKMGKKGREKRVSEKYHRAALINQLREMTVKLGRIPTRADIKRACRDRQSAGIRPFLREFGSLAEAYAAADLGSLLRSRTEPEE